MILNPNKISAAYSQGYVDIYSALLDYNCGKVNEDYLSSILGNCEQRITESTH